MPPATRTDSAAQSRTQAWLRLAAFILIATGLGLPINDLGRYTLLIAAAIAIFTGTLSQRGSDWALAVAAIAVATVIQIAFPAAKIEEGHNIFIVDGGDGTLERELPADAYRQMLAEFDARYPRDRRCSPARADCWRHGGFPDRAYAFSADAIYDQPALSRRVTTIDFTDPVWLRLGVINELQYNWTGTSDIQRNARNPWNVLSRWSITAPFFIVYRFPAEFVGSRLCYRGHLLWETAQQRFLSLQSDTPACRAIEADDISRSIFGVSIAAPLSMSLHPPLSTTLRTISPLALSYLSVLIVLMILVGRRDKRWIWPTACVAIVLIVAFLNDSSFIGGIRPFDGGDDGLVYEGMARRIVQNVLAGEWRSALIGSEPVFYYGGPGLRYLRAFEHFIFGDTFLGYLSVMLVFPLVVFAAAKRFLGTYAAFGITATVFLLPLGALFGSTLYLYVKWAARGFADPAAAFALMAGIVTLVGRDARGPGVRFWPSFAAGLLFALALFIRPNLAPAAAVLLSGAGLRALWQNQYSRLAGLCVGFAPVSGMALHNWVFGGVFVLFSSNATISEALVMSPSAWFAAASELIRFDLSGGHIKQAAAQLAFWLSGPSGSTLLIPIHAVAIAVLLRVAAWGRDYDPWLRLCAFAALAQHSVAWFYLRYDRYHHVTWLITLVVCAVWIRNDGLSLVRAFAPRIYDAIAAHPVRKNVDRLLGQMATRAGLIL